MLKKTIVLIFFIFIAITYLHNLTRDIYAGDIGDLVTAAYVGGVAHPPGYPLFSLMGYVLSHIPFPLPIVSRVGLISVVFSFLGILIFYKFCLRVSASIFIALLSTSVLALSYFFWLTAEIPEGLGLNNFFAIMILYLSFAYYEKKKNILLYLLAFFVGLSLTNQLNILTILPAVFLLLLSRYKYIFRKKRFIFALLFVFIGLSVYIYVPIAASKNPLINWDNASNLKNFIHLVLRIDYKGIVQGSVSTIPLKIRIINATNYFQSIVANFSYQILFLAILGLIKLFKKDKLLAIFLFFAFVMAGPVSVFVTTGANTTSAAWGIIERYYVLSTVIIMFAVPFGFILLRDFLNSKFSKPIYSYIILSYFIIIPVLLLRYNFPKTDLSKSRLGNSLARNILSQVPKNAVLFVAGDNTTFDIWYLHYVLGERSDVDIINPPGVGNNIFLDKELNAYYKKNPNVQIKEVIIYTFNEIRKHRGMYTTYLISPMPIGTVLIPQGLIFRVVDSSQVPEKKAYLKNFEEKWRLVNIQRRETLALSDQNFVATEIPLIYSMGLVRVGDFLIDQYDDPRTAESYYRRALWIDDENPQGYSGLAIALFKGYKDCSQTLYNINKAISTYPVVRNYYIQRYYFAKQCGTNNTILNKFKKEFEYLFGQNIEKSIKY